MPLQVLDNLPTLRSQSVPVGLGTASSVPAAPAAAYQACSDTTNTTVDKYNPITSVKELKGRLVVLGTMLLALIVYLCIGAGCFCLLESNTEKVRWEDGKARIEGYVKSTYPNATEKEVSNQTRVLTRLIRSLSETGNPYIFENREAAWSFTGGLYVSVSTVTTIGYGNIYPVTIGGQVFLVIFALVGIPLSFLFIAYLGALLASCVEYLLESPITTSSKEKGYNTRMLLVLLCSAGLVVLELLVFSMWIKFGLDRDMSYWESFYFAFVSFTTIGFGNQGFYNGDNANITKVIFTLLIVILCLAPLSLYINLLVRDVMSVASPILQKIGAGNLPEDEEKEMIANTKEFQGESYGAAAESTEN